MNKIIVILGLLFLSSCTRVVTVVEIQAKYKNDIYDSIYVYKVIDSDSINYVYNMHEKYKVNDKIKVLR